MKRCAPNSAGTLSSSARGRSDEAVSSASAVKKSSRSTPPTPVLASRTSSRERSSRSRSPSRATAAAAAEVPKKAAAKSEAQTELEPAAPSLDSGPSNYEELSSALGQIREGIRDLMSRTVGTAGYDHPFLSDCYDLLVSREVEPRLADRIVQQIALLNVPEGLPDPARVRSVVRVQLTKLFIPSPPLDESKKPRTLVLVGPTGVGKTTTIAKLAARAKINERQRVGLITLDTFRIAAVDQLAKYADIIGLPLKVAKNPEDLEAAVREFHSRRVDLIFIDSAGRSPRDELKMAELREFLSVLPSAEIHLVASTTTHGRSIESIARRFANLGCHMLILTKVDETVSFGSLLSVLIAIGRPVSFITDGQNVPDDIMPGEPERLADLVLKTSAL